MKKVTLIVFTALATLCATAQTRFWVFQKVGGVMEFEISNTDSISFTDPYLSAGERCKASEYRQVTIGTQTWMAENYKCSRYDTESEAYKASLHANNTIPTSKLDAYTPYYTDATDKSKIGNLMYLVNLSDEQIAKLGYLYNWAAAVGVDDSRNQTTAFTGNRQGICPNGWHIPSYNDWLTLRQHVYEDQKVAKDYAGKYLKTISGWYSYDGCSFCKQGTDSYGFAILPSGYSSGELVSSAGISAYFWSATLNENSSSNIYYMLLTYNNDLFFDQSGSTYNGYSVRCLKNDQ